MLDLIYKIRKGISNIIKWFPVIWNDRDDHYIFVYILLHYKLQNMEKFFRSDSTWSANPEKRADEIRIAKNLAKRLSDSSHLENATLFHDKKYEWFNPFEHFEESKTHPGLKTLLDDPNKERDNSFKRCCDHSNYMEKQDIECLFDIMKNKITHWWD